MKRCVHHRFLTIPVPEVQRRWSGDRASPSDIKNINNMPKKLTLRNIKGSLLPINPVRVLYAPRHLPKLLERKCLIESYQYRVCGLGGRCNHNAIHVDYHPRYYLAIQHQSEDTQGSAKHCSKPRSVAVDDNSLYHEHPTLFQPIKSACVLSTYRT